MHSEPTINELLFAPDEAFWELVARLRIRKARGFDKAGTATTPLDRNRAKTVLPRDAHGLIEAIRGSQLNWTECESLSVGVTVELFEGIAAKTGFGGKEYRPIASIALLVRDRRLIWPDQPNEHSDEGYVRQGIQHIPFVDAPRRAKTESPLDEGPSEPKGGLDAQSHVDLALAKIGAVAAAMGPPPRSLEEASMELRSLEKITTQILETSRHLAEKRLQAVLDVAAGKSFKTSTDNAAFVVAVNQIRKSLRLGLQLLDDSGAPGPKVNLVLNPHTKHGTFQAVTTTAKHELVYTDQKFPRLRCIT